MENVKGSYLRKIGKLRKERNAVILAHVYQVGDIQDIADFTGDSLELSRKAVDTDSDVIVFCGVRFMAETAAILNPDKMRLYRDYREFLCYLSV
ncbi:MAG: quinolinate synthase NadA [Phycisphaerae bacterium]|nr:quinolinate synthase NadA [Phycisphaerae bacterium]